MRDAQTMGELGEQTVLLSQQMLVMARTCFCQPKKKLFHTHRIIVLIKKDQLETKTARIEGVIDSVKLG